MQHLVNSFFRQLYRYRYRHIKAYMEAPQQIQTALWWELLGAGRATAWGKQHFFKDVHSIQDFSEAVPITEYDVLKPYIQQMMMGEKDILWPGQVKWFSKSSGTTNDKSKFIPVSSQNLSRCHIRGTWDTMTLYYWQRSNARQFADKSMLMGGSMSAFADYPATTVGDVSAIMIDRMPWIARPFFIPDFDIALMGDWEKKLELLARAGIEEPRVVMIGGVPTWTVVLMRRMLELTGKKNMLEIWPDFQVYIHGGVSFTPYKQQFKEFFPSDTVDYQEIYNASEGFFAIQDRLNEEGLLLLLNNGIFYEFIPMSEWEKPSPKAVPLWEVELGKNYAMVITTNSGLWRYCLGDTVQFTSIQPYRIKVTGRTKQFVNAFGEEMMVDNADKALAETCKTMHAVVSEYTVAPVYFDGANRGGHEWIIEFEKEPTDLSAFSILLDQNLQNINSDYEAKRYRNLAMLPLQIHLAPKGTFYNWMRARGKFGGQHKVPRLSNHREYLDDVLAFVGEGA
jgi:hypothetical protein